MAKPAQPKRSAQMKPAWELFEAGDVFAARRLARAVRQKPAAPEDEAEAEDLLARTGFPREALLYAGVAAGLIVALVLLALLRTGA